ncbi:glutamine--fructose-6-phosphate transaminase (isomerizing) [Mariprofundus erugo]|uniref:glutamine--fructose-6-phosphate transaminase (isomerizing) n=1 Tax=Mariprofundus erugo TaxID=2528639 RepID=UPI0010FE13CE|nr:glutamine--fructose-6-phosphate transaminase (isomerizing) [Mariprofundus erugo]TLS77075.1 glutamine--fructose-6-phosphate transaminase (isomerizing) [Mariprofundus erugo]
MCGIIGALSSRARVQGHLLDALQKMEYRGYDSAGICVADQGVLHCAKAAGKLAKLREKLAGSACDGSIGIGHTRWATHGAPNEVNAHPHISAHCAIVHNGIIENHAQLRRQLTSAGLSFASDTDTEVIPAMLSTLLDKCSYTGQAWHQMLQSLDGAYALAGLIDITPDTLWFARKGSPLLLARRGNDYFVASDALAVADLADEVMYLREGEWGCASHDGCQVFDAEGRVVACQWQEMPVAAGSTDKGVYRHYMEKEIHEQPAVLERILNAYIDDAAIHFPDAPWLSTDPLPERIVMVACGTSYHAALTARYWLERYLKVSVEVDVASEYRYRNPVIGERTMLITLSQSGETADTLEAMRLFKSTTPNNRALSICNVASASLPRESDGLIELLAGPEIGVASTKAYLAQLSVLALVALHMARRAGAMPQAELEEHIANLWHTVDGLAEMLTRTAAVSSVVPLFARAHGALFLGRGPCYPLALEGALKLKEISYLHAEGYAAGEMKHGPIALIDSNLPVIVIAPQQYQLDKVLSNLREVQARGARVILLTDLPEQEWPEDVDRIMAVPEGDYFTTPLLVCVPLQLLAYEVALAKGTDVDQPRNLAKSVTVE